VVSYYLVVSGEILQKLIEKHFGLCIDLGH